MTISKRYLPKHLCNRRRATDCKGNFDGADAHPTSFTSYMRKITMQNNLPRISPHSLRHMAATFLIRNGVDLRTVSGKLGHADGRMTMHYAHLLKSAEKETANIMGNLIDAAQNKKICENKKQPNNRLLVVDSFR